MLAAPEQPLPHHCVLSPIHWGTAAANLERSMIDEEAFSLNLLGADTTTTLAGGVAWLKTISGSAQPSRPAETWRVRTVGGYLLYVLRTPGPGPRTKFARTTRRRRPTAWR